MSVADRLTKELLVAALALAAASLAVAARLEGVPAAGPLPKAPPIEGPAEVAPEDVPVAKPRLITRERPVEGRDPFAMADLWEDPDPAPLPLPPEPAAGRVLPAMSIAGGRALAPRPPRLPALPAPVAEDPPPEGAPPGGGG
jgi:hypothetical protein